MRMALSPDERTWVDLDRLVAVELEDVTSVLDAQVRAGNLSDEHQARVVPLHAPDLWAAMVVTDADQRLPIGLWDSQDYANAAVAAWLERHLPAEGEPWNRVFTPEAAS